MNGDPNQLAASAIEADEFRRVLGCFVTGIAVVTTCQADGTPRCITVNSFTSVSLEPPLVLVCIAHNAESHSVFRDCSAFAISILSEGQQDASRLFATKSPTKFDEVSWHPGRCGAPILDAAAAWLDCVQAHSLGGASIERIPLDAASLCRRANRTAVRCLRGLRERRDGHRLGAVVRRS